MVFGGLASIGFKSHYSYNLFIYTSEKPTWTLRNPENFQETIMIQSILAIYNFYTDRNTFQAPNHFTTNFPFQFLLQSIGPPNFFGADKMAPLAF